MITLAPSFFSGFSSFLDEFDRYPLKLRYLALECSKIILSSIYTHLLLCIVSHNHPAGVVLRILPKMGTVIRKSVLPST